jgi:hypothetical protein
MTDRQPLITALLERHGRTFPSELGIDLRRNTPSPLFRLLCLSLLTSAPVQADIAMQAAQALGKAGWTTPKKLRDSSWQARVAILNKADYARIDEKTATQIAELNDTLLTQYNGDLRKLRDRADGNASQAHKAIKAIKAFQGIGDVGARIFLREVQGVWTEFYPYADKATLKAAKKLDLPDDTQTLSGRVDQRHFPRLVAALVRVQLAKDFKAIQQAAAG